MINSDVLNRTNNKRFKSGIEFQKQLLQLTRSIQDRLLANLPSNYSKDRNTNLSEFFRVVAKEFARLQISTSDINEDKYHTQTRTEYLFQILGDSLFLGEHAINEALSDVAYKNFLIRVRNAYMGGSRKDNIEGAVSDIVGLPVKLKEVYLELRKKNSSYTVKDTNKMFFDIFMDGDNPASNVGTVLQDLKFFIDIIKPAHVLYDTRLVWTDEFKNKEATCIPSYIMENMEYEVYGTTRIFMVTYLGTKIYKVITGTYPLETWNEGTIRSVDTTAKIIYLEDERILVYDGNTKLYYRNFSGDSEVPISVFQEGDIIYYYADKDTDISSDVIENTWTYTGTVDDIFLSEGIVSLSNSALLVFNKSSLCYTRDGFGEHRIEVEDLLPNKEIVFKAEKYIRSFQFYVRPPEVQVNFFKQFDGQVIEKPSFQEYVYKNKDIPEGIDEGYSVVVEDGVAKVVNTKSKFYKRENSVNYTETKIDKYSLYLSGEYQAQFVVEDPERALTQEEAKKVFVDTYGYTGIQAPGTDYKISVSHTGQLTPDGKHPVVQAINDQTEMCDRRASCFLDPKYEDTRKYFTWPDIQLTSGFFVTYHDFGQVSTNGVEDDDFNIPAWYYLSSNDNNYTMPSLPMLGPTGELATISDLKVYLDGRLINDSITSFDPWTGIFSLNFIPPFNTTLRVDYYFSKRFPDPVFYLTEIASDNITSQPNILQAHLTIIGTGGVVKKLYFPFEVTDPDLCGDDCDYQVNKFPILNQAGELAQPSDITVFLGTEIVTGQVQVTSIVTGGVDTGTTFTSMGVDFINVQDNDVLVIRAENYLESTLTYTILSVDTLSETIFVANILPELNAIYDFTIVRFTEVPNSVVAVRPLFGHVKLNFIPPFNTFIKFNYYHTAYNRQYLMLPDTLDASDPNNPYLFYGYTPDVLYGPRYGYTVIEDQDPADWRSPYWDFDKLLKIGYRYRAFDLAHTSALDSEQMKTDSYDAYKGRASFNSKSGLLDQYSVIFSPEYLTDTDKNVELNDKYLYKNITPTTILNKGVPLFVKTYTDDGHYRRLYYADEHDTYDGTSSSSVDLKAGFTIINPDESGLIDFNPVCSYSENKKINLYSKLKQVEFPNDGFDAPIATIDDSASSNPMNFMFIDQYYPNREQRLVDYLDYINQVPFEYRTGDILVRNGSVIVKSPTGNFKTLNVGDSINIKNVILEEGTLNQYARDIGFTLVKIIDFETAELNKPFEYKSGKYDYSLVRSKTIAVDVMLAGGDSSMVGNLNRTLVINGELDYSYSLPDSVRSHYAGYGVTGIHQEFSFPDPDPDPYPRNPDNPGIPNPSGISYYAVGTVYEYTVDVGVTYVYPMLTNCLQNITGIIRTSQVIDEFGRTYGVTGMLSGFTGPVGALDIGITGPVEYANPHTIEGYDTYFVPAGISGSFIAFSEAEQRVRWRNWDQEMIFISYGMTGMPEGILYENPINMMDDIGEGIKQIFWSVGATALREIVFQGSVISTMELVSGSVPAASYPYALMLLDKNASDRVRASSYPNPALDPDLADIHLADTSYKLYTMIIREILQDDSIKVTEIQLLKA